MQYTVEQAFVSKTDVGKYKNTVYSVKFKDQGKLVELMRKADSPMPQPGDVLEGEIEDTQYGLKFKSAQKPFGGGGGDSVGQAWGNALTNATNLITSLIATGKTYDLTTATADIIATAQKLFNGRDGAQSSSATPASPPPSQTAPNHPTSDPAPIQQGSDADSYIG